MKRQLLVAMIETTLDMRFEDKIHSECAGSTAARAAGLCDRGADAVPPVPASRGILIALGGDLGEALQAIDALRRKHLITVEERVVRPAFAIA